MAKYIFQRLVYMFITLFIIATASFFLMKQLPGSPFKAEEKLSAAQLEILYEKYNLNDPLPIQYLNYLGNLFQGDLGVSFQMNNQPVTEILMSRIPVSAHLGIQAMIIGTIIGMLLGVVAALYSNSIIDYASNIISVIGISIPSFIFAGLLQYYLGVELGILPVAFWGSFAHTIMPTIALAIFPLAISARFVRTELIEVLGSDYIVTARAKGVSNATLMFKHGLRNALIPLVTVMGPMAVSLMTGTLVIEQIFAVPGIGEQFVTSIMTDDFPIIMGTTLFFAFFFILIILVIDILYGIIDPRIRIAGGKD
ncbi:peptide ABC transporter permease [Thalassobacillus devorans]|uniref:Peptide ABC transporter permease n=1 Tax=Thalassobacillus devorans TaxID=279813 RepID=A0ABQ1NEH0_9BACI|nr:oligopeptide ABC transporter permease [Thalassobacillus devorans]NIK27067.1 oligopeptide transport system permease protein [Thalassobacillus devorans]GGC74646.1 peptide ABC transporter permease [Thalassobacillus devorans]